MCWPLSLTSSLVPRVPTYSPLLFAFSPCNCLPPTPPLSPHPPPFAGSSFLRIGGYCIWDSFFFLSSRVCPPRLTVLLFMPPVLGPVLLPNGPYPPFFLLSLMSPPPLYPLPFTSTPTPPSALLIHALSPTRPRPGAPTMLRFASRRSSSAPRRYVVVEPNADAVKRFMARKEKEYPNVEVKVVDSESSRPPPPLAIEWRRAKARMADRHSLPPPLVPPLLLFVLLCCWRCHVRHDRFPLPHASLPAPSRFASRSR